MRVHERAKFVVAVQCVRDWPGGFRAMFFNLTFGSSHSVLMSRIDLLLLGLPLDRKHFLYVGARGCHLSGIGGPGAPHVFALDRLDTLTGISACTNFDENSSCFFWGNSSKYFDMICTNLNDK